MIQAVETADGRRDFLRFVRERAGLTMRSDLEDRVWAGARSAMSRLNVNALTDLTEVLTRDQDAFDAFVDEVTVGETHFLRIEEHFEWIRSRVLPEFRMRFGPHRIFRVWSAGCSTGEEAYSLAMLLDEEGFGDRSRVIATDISRASLAVAQRGCYRSWSLRGMPSQVQDHYFRTLNRDLSGGRREWFQLSPRIKKRVEFAYHNLVVDPYPPLEFGLWDLDLILCRNVLIYFDQETAMSVGERMSRCLAPGGWLIPGPSEPLLTTVAALQAVTAPGLFVYRTARAMESIRLPTAAPSPKAETRTRHVGAPPSATPDKRRALAVATSTELGSADTVDPSDALDPLWVARRALAGGDYARAIAITKARSRDEDANIIRLRALANSDLPQAMRLSRELAHGAPLSEEIQYLRAVLLLSLGRPDEARGAARRLLYLTPSLAVGHVLQASILRRDGDTAGARRSYRNALSLCLSVPHDALVRFGEGETAGRLAEATRRELEILNEARGGRT